MNSHNNYTSFTDGLDHINVYSRGKTLLGKYLSNFARTPVMISTLRFASVESWWFYKKMKNINAKYTADKLYSRIPFSSEDLGIVQNLIGVDAKYFFNQKVKAINYLKSEDLDYAEPTPEQVEAVFRLKVNQNTEVRRLLKESTLPFAHYYEMHGHKVNADKYLYMADIWFKIREELQDEDDN